MFAADGVICVEFRRAMKGANDMGKRLFAVVVVALGMVGVCGCWSPLVVGERRMEKDETIYGFHIQPLVGFSKHKVVGVNVAARLEPDISGDRLPNASGVVGLAVGAVNHEVWGDVCGVQIGGIAAEARRGAVNGLQVGGIGAEASVVRGVQIAGGGNEAKRCHGVQLSLLGNVAWEAGNCATNTSRCVQVGLVNICGDHWFPLVNFNFRDCENGDIKKWFALKFCPW